MVTRSVILVTPSEAAAFAATSTLPSSAAAVVADSVINNAPAEQKNTELQIEFTKRAQHPSPGGLVQLCRHKGCFHAVDFERRNGGLCCIHQKGLMDGEQSDSEDFSKDDAKICGGTADKNCLGEVGKKRAHLSEDSISGKNDIKRQRVDAFVLDLTGVPPQPPIPKSAGRIKEGASKYTGVTFNTRTNKWLAKIRIEGKQRHIGSYESEEEAAVDYARAVVKLKGQGALDKAREAKKCKRDLSDVPPQPPIPKRPDHIKEGASKYIGVSFDKKAKKWQAQISIAGKSRCIGCYESEEKAAADYARAVLKYKGRGALDNAREQRARDKSRVDAFDIDLTGVPPQSPIPKSAGHIKEGASKYKGVHFNKLMKKWHARIYIDGEARFIGYYDNEDEAATDYARSVFKYKGQGELDKARERRARDKSGERNSFIIDLSDVPPQPPIPKVEGRIKVGASKCTGVSFDKRMKKWKAQIRIEGKQRYIGYYDNEEEAATDYARAVFKYKGQGAPREQNSIIHLSDVPP